jgi:hypothetical protein
MGEAAPMAGMRERGGREQEKRGNSHDRGET